MIEVRGLTKHYGALCAVDHLDFSIERGEVVGFLGPNGAGKSTTMRMLTGCLAPDTGDVSIGGVRDPARSTAARARIGYLPENAPLYRAMRVDRYLDFCARLVGITRRERPRALFAAAESVGLETHVGRRIDELSKGYRQRVGLAQALLGDPQVLILDEPTSGLDPGEIQRIRALVRDLGRSRTVLLSTHVLSEIEEVCGRVLILACGRLVADGHPRDLVEGGGATLTLEVRLDRMSGTAGALAQRLERVADVASVRTAGDRPDGIAAFALELGSAAPALRRAAAERVVREVAAAGASLIELRHEAPTLERVFLQRTDPSFAAAHAVAAKSPTGVAP